MHGSQCWDVEVHVPQGRRRLRRMIAGNIGEYALQQEPRNYSWFHLPTDEWKFEP